MGKGKSITLLTIISVLMAFVLVMTFARFPMGVKDYNSALGAIELDYDLEGGVAYTLSLSKDNEIEVENVDEVISIISGRLDSLGYKTYNIKAIKSTDEAVKDYDIRVEIKDSENADSDMKTVKEFGKVKFYGGTEQNPSAEILSDVTVIKDAKFAGADGNGKYVVAIEFYENACKDLLALIEKEQSYYLKVTCGEDEQGNENVLFNSSITKDAFMGNVLGILANTEEEAHRLTLQMKKGGLEYRYDMEKEGKVSSPYGKNVDLKCAVAIMTTVLAIMILLCALYRGLGIVSSLSLLLFILGETWLMLGVPGIVLSMGGVMGIMASTIVCGISLIITMQKIKDEYANSQKTVKAAIHKGFMSSLVPVISGHVSCGAIALLMLGFTTGLVKNFAITFGIGIAVSLITALLFTRMFNAVILPLPKDKEKFLRFRRNEEFVESEKEAE